MRNKRLDAHYWLRSWVLDTRDHPGNHTEDVSMELAKIAREADRLSYLVRAAEWMQGGTLTETQFLEIVKKHRAK